MRASSSVGAWLFFGGVALACSGTSFSPGDSGDAGSGGSPSSAGNESRGGVLNRAGRGNGGTKATAGTNTGGSDVGGSDTDGGTTSSGGVGTAGDVSVGGDISVGGDVSVAGTSSSGGSSAGTTSMGGSAGTNSGPPVDEVCPKSIPNSGGSCKNGLSCSYGTDLRADCRNIAKCSGGKWSLDKPACSALMQCEGVIVGDACIKSSPACSLDSGVFCVCSACDGNGVCGAGYTWSCAGGQGGAACPKSPPNEGQACASGATCPYGSCSAGSNITASCVDEVWSWQHDLCPLATQ